MDPVGRLPLPLNTDNRLTTDGAGIPRAPSSAPEDRGALRRSLAALSPTQFLHFPQNQFEDMLDAFVAEYGVRVDRGVELVGLEAATSRSDPTSVSLRHM